MKKEKLQMTTELQRIVRLLQPTVCPANGHPGMNGQILRKVQSPNTEPGRNRKYEQTNHKHWNWNGLKSSQQTSPGPDGFTGEFCQTFWGRVNPHPFETVSENCRGR